MSFPCRHGYPVFDRCPICIIERKQTFIVRSPVQRTYWINRMEREPERKGSILTYGKHGFSVAVWDYECWLEPLSNRTVDFTHWAPLPEPPA